MTDYPTDAITGFPDHYIINGDTSSCPCPEHRTGPARDELMGEQCKWVPSPEYGSWFSRLLDAYAAEERQRARAEALREAADAVAKLDGIGYHPMKLGAHGEGWDAAVSRAEEEIRQLSAEGGEAQ